MPATGRPPTPFWAYRMSEDVFKNLSESDGTRSSLAPTLGASTLFNLLEAMVQLAERNQREHKVFSQDVKSVRDSLQGSFNNFAAETQKAYQQLRKEIHGEKRISLVLFNELLEVGQDLEHVVAARPRIG